LKNLKIRKRASRVVEERQRTERATAYYMNIIKKKEYMKGIILAGGTGSRLFPSTKVTNKHLLPVFSKPMIFYPIDTLKNSGIRDILIISDDENIGDFMKLLGSGKEFGVDFTYKVQDGAGGIAHALSLGENFAAGGPLAVILADNIFEDAFTEDIFYFKNGAHIFVSKVDDSSRFGVAELRDDDSVKSLEEKPTLPKSNLAATGFYLYDENLFNYIREVEPSERGELEITDVNKIYLKKNQLRASRVSGMWIDAGTHESLLEASILAQEAFDPERVKLRRAHQNLNTEKIEKTAPKITIGILTNNSEKYVSTCLQSLENQDYENIEIVVLDNGSSDRTCDIINGKFSKIKLIESDRNDGFSKGNNEILRETESDFYLAANIDMIFEPDFVSQLLRSIDQKPIYASVGGKVKRWDFENFMKTEGKAGKTNFIDSVGLRILKSHRFENIGEGEVDYGQFDASNEIFGVSGSAVLYRRKALEDVSFKTEDGEKEYFDESMFMYKEDIDLAYRLQWAGWKASYTPEATAYHDRTVISGGGRALSVIRNRTKKTKFINRLSYLNHQILIQKNFADDFSMGVRSATFWYNLKTFIYLIIFETELLGQWWKFFKMRKTIAQKRRSMPRRVSKGEIEKLMEL
jgi:glucose-1-phosphate thymidylyltransferase